MKILINILLSLIVVGLAWLLISNISEPIEFESEYRMREKAVANRLIDIRDAQQAYRGVTDRYAHNFDTLVEVLRNDTFEIVKVFGNPDDPDAPVQYSTEYIPAIDSIIKMGINLDSLPFVPYSNGERFEITSDVIKFQSMEVPVLEVSVQKKEYMGKYGASRYMRYDPLYNPNDRTKFGDLTKPSTAGNWRK